MHLKIDRVGKVFHAGAFATAKGRFVAVDRVSFEVSSGEVFGLLGETGSGKTTLGRMIVGLIAPSEGRIMLEGKEIRVWLKREPKRFRQNVQMVFQDPFSSLNPTARVREILLEPQKYLLGRDDEAERVEALREVGLSPEMLDRYPHELSGGQRQRVSVARSLIVRPRLLVADEPVSMLDASLSASVMRLFRDLHAKRKFTLLIISHDVRLLEHLADRIGVLYRGRLVELGFVHEVIKKPLHPYTQELMRAVPRKGKRIGEVAVEVEEHTPQAACPFYHRCPLREDGCWTGPILLEGSGAHLVACPPALRQAS